MIEFSPLTYSKLNSNFLQQKQRGTAAVAVEEFFLCLQIINYPIVGGFALMTSVV
jgi:hypothetical protein